MYCLEKVVVLVVPIVDRLRKGQRTGRHCVWVGSKAQSQAFAQFMLKLASSCGELCDPGRRCREQ